MLVDALLVDGREGKLARRALEGAVSLQVPAVFTAEVTSAIRSATLREAVSPEVALQARRRLRSIDLLLFPFEPFAERVWELRRNVTVYDGWYIALAEALGTDLVTADLRLVGAPGLRCPVVDVASFGGS